MTGTEICPKCGTHFDGIWWQNAEEQLDAVVAALSNLVVECKRQDINLGAVIGDAEAALAELGEGK